MKRLAAVALREVAERRFVLVAAATAAVLPFLVPLLPGVPHDQAIATRSVVALVFSCAFGLGGSLLVGASVVGRELAERRLSFHFAQPLAAPVVWGGKLVGGLALVLISELVVLFPTSLLSGAFPGLPGISLDTPVLWAILLLAVPFFLLAWVGSVALRSRSPWLVVDLVLLWGLPGLLFVIVRRLLRYGHAPEPSWLVGAASALLLALLAATLAQVVAGRTDARRGHGAQSLTLWGILLVATAGAGVLAERAIDPGLERLVRAGSEPAGPDGRWVFVQGTTRESGAGWSFYLANLATGERRLLPAGWTATVSADGSRAISVTGPWLGSSKEVTLEAADLRGGPAVEMSLPGWPDGIALTLDGRRLAVVSKGLCSVFELPSFKSLASARVPSPSWSYEPSFVTHDRVRLYPRRSAWRAPDGTDVARTRREDPEAAELEVGRKALVKLATWPLSEIPAAPARGLESGPSFQLLPSPDLSRVLVLGFGAARSVRLLDALTGRVLASVDGSEADGRPTGRFLADGRAVVVEPVEGGRRLAVFSRDGERVAEVALPAGTTKVRMGSEAGQDLLTVGLAAESKTEKWDWAIVDLGSGRVRPLGFEGIPFPFWSAAAIPPAGSPAARLAHEKGTGRLVLFDPATGETKPLTRGKDAGK